MKWSSGQWRQSPRFHCSKEQNSEKRRKRSEMLSWIFETVRIYLKKLWTLCRSYFFTDKTIIVLQGVPTCLPLCSSINIVQIIHLKLIFLLNYVKKIFYCSFEKKFNFYKTTFNNISRNLKGLFPNTPNVCYTIK